MNILKRVPNSILWLLEYPIDGKENLLKEAEKRGV
jgi:predicted O-linked N-acetylglucosamine transferase (SPINDLY family)